jgi:alpha-galactosidase
MNRTLLLVVVSVLVLLGTPFSQGDTLWLDEMDLSYMTCGWEKPQKNASIFGKPLRINGQAFPRGVGTHAPSVFLVDLHGSATRFTAYVGIDNEIRQTVASVEFQVVADNELVWKSHEMGVIHGPTFVDVDLTGVQQVALYVTDYDDGSNCDHADWAEAKFEYTGKKPTPVAYETPKPYILTPPTAPEPRINGPDVVGVRPGSTFLFSIPATGLGPLQYFAEGLPSGLRLNTLSGHISGQVTKPGIYEVALTVRNRIGDAKKVLEIRVGDEICLTPPMGWNSWNCWNTTVDAEKILDAARMMVKTGLIRHGWTYINIDDSWQAERGGEFNAIQGNERFPSLQNLCDEIHAMGLKVGIYSTPWKTSFAGFPGGSSDSPDGVWERPARRHLGWQFGTYSFAAQDVKQWTKWGIDFLKYDWKDIDVPHAEEMANLLKTSGRDIVFSLSNSAPIEMATEWSRIANSWRTTGDIRDNWGSIEQIGFSQGPWADYARPGHWNDADMLVVGKVGWGPILRDSRLTPDEQYLHVSLWCLLASPLLLGCDLSQMDDFTLSLLTNDEVLAVNQDRLGVQARPVRVDGKNEVWAKPMSDGSIAAGLFNRGYIFGKPSEITLRWSDLNIQGRYRVRDLWRQEDLGIFDSEFTASVPVHGVVLVRLFPAS